MLHSGEYSKIQLPICLSVFPPKASPSSPRCTGIRLMVSFSVLTLLQSQPASLWIMPSLPPSLICAFPPTLPCNRELHAETSSREMLEPPPACKPSCRSDSTGGKKRQSYCCMSPCSLFYHIHLIIMCY